MLEFMKNLTGNIVDHVECELGVFGVGDGEDYEVRIEIFVENGTVAEDTAYGGDFFRGRARGEGDKVRSWGSLEAPCGNA